MLSLIPVSVLLLTLAVMIVIAGADSAQTWGPWMLAGAAVVAAALSLLFTRVRPASLYAGLRKSASQILPAVPILFLIGTLSATWMLSGVVPLLIDYGLMFLQPQCFLVTACCVCAAVSLVTGSSWTTVATIGVAFMGVGTVMGYSLGWIAGAIISGAYFGDKMSPLSDTTVLASSSCGVKLFTHIRNMMATSMPAMGIALVVYAVAGFVIDTAPADANAITHAIGREFHLTSWLLVIPGITCVMIALRADTLLTLAVSTLTGLAGIWIFQPEIASDLTGSSPLIGSLRLIAFPTSLSTGNAMLDELSATGGALGMLPTVLLILCAMLFGGVMIGSGMLSALAGAITSRLHGRNSLVSATVASGVGLNMLTGDQYLSIILGGNIYSDPYRRCGVSEPTLSRALEDSVSVTSVLIPWNSCGLTQATVLGVATLAYAPYCLFNILSPLMSVAVAWVVTRRKAAIPRLA
ncbi:MAG: sodium:proton antiporter [Muribaculaceae bacterium]|nr:sodium:proton antiporter [Muribaculaceae bacterium]